MRYPPPPANIEPFIRILGPAKAMEFLLAYGGARYSFRPRPQEASPVVQLIGREAVIALSEELLPPKIPTGKPWIAAVMREKGLSVLAIARTLHVSENTVREWTKRQGWTVSEASPTTDDPRQLRLF